MNSENVFDRATAGAVIREFVLRNPGKLTIKDERRQEPLNVVGIPTYVLLSVGETGGAFSLFETHDGPQQGPPLHIHRNETELIYILEGRYRLCQGDTVTDVSPGAVGYFPIGVPHTYANIGSGPGRALIMTVPGGYERFFRALDAASKSGAVDVPRLVSVAQEFGVEIVGPPLVPEQDSAG